MHLSLEPYQRLMVDFLQHHDRGGLWVSPGMGKSAAVLTVLKSMLAEGEISRALVVAPLRVARLTWPNEVEKWDEFKFLRLQVLRGKDRLQPSTHLATTNYENLHNVTTLDPYDVVILDESTRAKNHKSVRINALRPLFKQQKRWELTGTPRPNRLQELFAQIRLLDDGKRLSPSFSHFQSTFFAAREWHEYNWDPKPGAEQRIYEKIKDITLTLRASDYLDIPDTIVEDIEIALPKDAHDLYRKLERDLLLLLKGRELTPAGRRTGATAHEVVATNAAVLVNKLLQVASGSVYDVEGDTVHIHNGKLHALQRLLDGDLKDENVIIACNYVHERERVLEALGKDAVDLSTFKGDIEKAWNGGGIKYLLAHPDSLGHGLNLQDGGRAVVWFSPTWSREKYDQLNARVARKGQGRETLIFRLLCSGTIDDAVAETLRSRGEQQGAMLELLTNWQKLGPAFST